jgi:hypothetical protein
MIGNGMISHKFLSNIRIVLMKRFAKMYLMGSLRNFLIALFSRINHNMGRWYVFSWKCFVFSNEKVLIIIVRRLKPVYLPEYIDGESAFYLESFIAQKDWELFDYLGHSK